MFGSNAFYKLASVFIAITLTIFVYGERNPPNLRTLAIPLVPVKKSDDIIIRSIPATVRIEIQGPKDSVMRITPALFQARVNLDGQAAGTHRLAVNVEPAPGVVLPMDVDVRTLDVTATLTLQEQTSQKKPVEPVFLYPPPPGFSYGLPTVQPTTATILGSANDVARVAQLQARVDTQPRAGAGINGNFPIRAVDSQGVEIANVETRPAQVLVKVAIQGMPAQKEILVSASITGTPAPGFRIVGIDVVPQSILVTGRPEVLARLNFVPTQEIDIHDASTNTVRSVQMLLPEGVTTLGSRRVRVDIRIAAKP